MMSASEGQSAEETLQFITTEEKATINLGNTENLPGEEKAPGGNMSLPVNLTLSSPMLREWFTKRRERIRPWGTFFHTSSFNSPEALPKLTRRLYRNVEHFQSNYVLVFLVLFLYCLITSPLLLIVLAANGGACYILSLKQQERKLVIGGREISLAQQYAGVALCSIPLLLLAGAGSAVFWVLGASFFFVGLHAAFYNYDALDLPDEDVEPLTGNIVIEV